MSPEPGVVDARVVEVVGRIVGHAEPLHDALRAEVRRRGERHELAETELVCDNVAVLSKGKLIAQGSITELLRSHDTVRLRSTDDATASQILREISWVEGVRADDGYLLVDADMERSWEISRALAQRGVHVRELTPLHRSLEEYFMEITETDPTTGRAKS